ncbi:EAL domain-containing protein [Achromobacter seleniivolatilans]|uniref:EAL domain-containing protein n=1 Tax=Achromobacter seleniivolatilans TaxID=3047478 RepID=A0ABY9LZN3_9BURK|nr:EAL domain-containing protein [Achromobacter sp. R39]WMD20228.1 EAL domain-containing protein [Achromobacter sp. R39]
MTALTFGPTPHCASALNALLDGGMLRTLRNANGLEALILALCEQEADLVVCEVPASASEGLLVPARLQKEVNAGRLSHMPAVLWISDLPSCVLDAYASGLRAAGAVIDIVRSAAFIPASLSRISQWREPAKQDALTPRFSDEDLILALAGKDGIRVVLQPQVDLGTGKILGAEALTRWRHPKVGDVPPSEFVQAISRLSMDPMLFHFVTERVLDVQAVLAAQGVSLRISVNASVSTLSIPGVALSLEERTLRRGISPNLITVEITEDETIKEKTALEQGLKRLRAAGFGVSMDDFGTGASTLERLTRLPFSELKIDQSFVKRLQSDPASHAVVTAAMGLGRALGLAVVAEGVETEEQARQLHTLGCRIGQGFGLGRPMEVGAFIGKVLPATLDSCPPLWCEKVVA